MPAAKSLRSRNVVNGSLPQQIKQTLRAVKTYNRTVGGMLRTELDRVRQSERQEIASRLHDSIGQDLILAKMKVDRLKSLLPQNYAGLAKEISELIGRNIGDTRTLIRELSVESLSDGDFKQTLDSLAAEIQLKYRLACAVESEEPPPWLGNDLRRMLGQTVRELLVNAAKHAAATRVKIVFESSAQSIRIQVVDNGRGFDTRVVSWPRSDAGGFGLFSVRTRLERAGATFSLQSRRGAGTTATIILPSRGIA
jgi:signal transduction histidine kinase